MLCSCKLTSCCRFLRFNCSRSVGQASAQHLGGCQTKGLASTNPIFLGCDRKAMVVWGLFLHCGKPFRSTCLRNHPSPGQKCEIWRSVSAPKKMFARLRDAMSPAWKLWTRALNDFSEVCLVGQFAPHPHWFWKSKSSKSTGSSTSMSECAQPGCLSKSWVCCFGFSTNLKFFFGRFTSDQWCHASI